MAQIISVIRNVNIEPLCFVFSLALSMMVVIRQDFLYQVIKVTIKQQGNENNTMIQTVCINVYGISGSNCSETVKANTTVKHDIESTTTYYIQACTLIESIIPSIICLFVGPWTDEYGRKWPIVSDSRQYFQINRNC